MARALRRFRQEARTAHVVTQVGAGDGLQTAVAVELGRHLAHHLCEQALEVTNAGLTGVVGSKLAQSVVLDDHVLGGQAGQLQLLGQQVLAGDGGLLVLGVAVEAHEFHAVEQRAGGWSR